MIYDSSSVVSPVSKELHVVEELDAVEAEKFRRQPLSPKRVKIVLENPVHAAWQRGKYAIGPLYASCMLKPETKWAVPKNANGGRRQFYMFHSVYFAAEYKT